MARGHAAWPRVSGRKGAETGYGMMCIVNGLAPKMHG